MFSTKGSKPGTRHSSAAGRVRRRQKEHTRQQLLAAARQALAAKGYHRTRVADIARAANVAVGTVYLYFPTKEALFLALVNDIVELLKVEMDALRRDLTNPIALVRGRNDTFFRFAQRHRDLFRIVFGESNPFHEVVRRAQRMFIADVSANLQAGMDMGVFRRNNPELLAQAFVGMAAQVVHWWVEQDSASNQEVSEALLDFVFYGLRCGPASEIPWP